LQQNESESEDLMASKTKGSTNGAESIETALHSGAEAMKDGFEKAAKNYDHFMNFSKDTAEAMIKCANAAGKGIETINGEIFAYARKSLEESITATKAIMASKSVDEAVQLQSDYSKAAFETYVDELAKFGDLALATTKDAATPLQARVSAFVDLVRTA
jgi:phasin family protein